MEKISELIMQLHPAIMFAIGALFALLRMFLNGVMYKKFNLYKEKEYLDGIPFQFVKVVLLVFGGLITAIALVFTPTEQLEIVVGIYAALVIASITYDTAKIMNLYTRLQKMDSEGSVE